MQKIETFIAQDKEVFMSESECARHELYNCAGVLEKIEEAVAEAPISHQRRWCNTEACGCMGCINREFYEAGLTQANWEIWDKELRKEKTFGAEEAWDKSMDYEICSIHIKDIGPNNKEVIAKVRNLTGLGSVEALNIVNNNLPFKEDLYRNVKEYKKSMEDLGATVEINHAGSIQEYISKKPKI